MLMKDPKKNIAMIISSKLGKPEEKPMEDGAEQDSSIGHKSAAEEIMKAIESKDSSMLMEALKSFYEMCANEPEAEPSDSEKY